jgi:DNA-3-methyladenine glycosylase
MLLDENYFKNNNTVYLAQDLIGKYLCCKQNGIITRHLISETEAYHGLEDKASHARFGKTPRNAVMFGEGGVCYVYLCYGIHWLFNIVTGIEGFPAAILIRGVDNIFGPGRVTKILNLNGSYTGKVLHPDSGIWIEDLGYKPNNIVTTSRVGINYALDYKDKPWRFILQKCTRENKAQL